jgi:hypothetical protein
MIHGTIFPLRKAADIMQEKERGRQTHFFTAQRTNVNLYYLIKFTFSAAYEVLCSSSAIYLESRFYVI